jgi:hypothetical protein
MPLGNLIHQRFQSPGIGTAVAADKHPASDLHNNPARRFQGGPV